MTEKKKTLAVGCGGTGGHFYPGLSIARSFVEKGGRAILFIAGHNTEEHVNAARAAGIEAVAVPAVRLPRSPIKALTFPFQMLSCINQSKRELRRLEVDIALGMGSWASIPMTVAATRLKIPLALHEGNSIPGQANRWLSKKAKLVGLSLPLRNPLNSSAAQIMVGMPLRQEIIDASRETVDDAKRAEICQSLELDPANPVCLVFGGSQGAQAINSAITAAIPAIVGMGADWQLIHLTGQDDNSAETAVAKEAGLKAVIQKRDPNIHKLFQIADGIICRAGASTILELAVMGNYPLLIPLPTAKDDHQTANAQCVASAGGGQVIKQDSLTTQSIIDYLRSAIEKNRGDNPGIRSLACPDAASAMAEELLKL